MALFNLNPESTDLYTQFKDYLSGAAGEALKDVYGGGKKDAQEDIKRLLSAIGYGDSYKEAFEQGAMNIQPGYLASNFRSPGQIQALRKMIAEEMRSRGSGAGPIDQILRGSWYHGMSDVSRRATQNPLDLETLMQFGSKEPTVLNQRALAVANEMGFPLSLHDAQSISNKLGEPAGVSISMLPTKAKQFSADDYIHRVLPQYGGPPTERTVNLMTPEGRTALNDAYDVVLNSQMREHSVIPELANSLGEGAKYGQELKSFGGNSVLDFFNNVNYHRIGPFNQQLSNQLQSSGYRGILYNPRRWDEYEMLMLDPKYVLPLDYRRVGDYKTPINAWSTKPNLGQQNPEITNMTPGMAKGIDQIQDDMSKNASRLGDIYSERPWTERLNVENKNSLLQLIDEQYREIVGNQLFRGY